MQGILGLHQCFRCGDVPFSPKPLMHVQRYLHHYNWPHPSMPLSTRPADACASAGSTTGVRVLMNSEQHCPDLEALAEVIKARPLSPEDMDSIPSKDLLVELVRYTTEMLYL